MADNKVLYLRIPEEMHERISTIADADRRKINVTAQILLEEALAARAAHEGKASEWQIHML